MYHNVTFKSKYKVDMDAHPKGEELAKYIYEKLEQKGLKISDFDNYDDFAWTVEVGSSKTNPWLLTGYIGYGDIEWLIQIRSGVGFIGRLLGKKNDETECDHIATKLDEILKEDEIFSMIRWHKGDFTKEDYRNAP